MVLQSREVLAKILGSGKVKGIDCETGLRVSSPFNTVHALSVDRLPADTPQEYQLQPPSHHFQQGDPSCLSEDMASK